MPAKTIPQGALAPNTTPTTHARDGLATPAQACEFLSVSRQYLWLRAREGRLQPIKFGRLVRYKWSDIEAIASFGFPAQSAQGSQK